MTYPRRLLTEGEDVIREFRPHWRLLIIPFLWVVFLLALVYLTWRYPPDNSGVDWTITAILGVVFLYKGFYPFIAWWFTHYVLTTERIIRRSGILSRKGKEIPLENINDLAFSQTILERVLHSGDLLIESAGEQGQQRFADIPEPEAFQGLVYNVREMRTKELRSGKLGNRADSAAVLKRYEALLAQGLITQKDFDRKKRELDDEAK